MKNVGTSVSAALKEITGIETDLHQLGKIVTQGAAVVEPMELDKTVADDQFMEMENELAQIRAGLELLQQQLVGGQLCMASGEPSYSSELPVCYL